MNVIVFGPTGGTGRALIEQGLAMGHAMTAFFRCKAFRDKARMEELLEASTLDWIAVRPGFLTNGRPAGPGASPTTVR